MDSPFPFRVILQQIGMVGRQTVSVAIVIGTIAGKF
jgi:hypothetical protein